MDKWIPITCRADQLSNGQCQRKEKKLHWEKIICSLAPWHGYVDIELTCYYCYYYLRWRVILLPDLIVLDYRLEQFNPNVVFLVVSIDHSWTNRGTFSLQTTREYKCSEQPKRKEEIFFIYTADALFKHKEKLLSSSSTSHRFSWSYILKHHYPLPQKMPEYISLNTLVELLTYLIDDSTFLECRLRGAN
jgi:hypothetical protein